MLIYKKLIVNIYQGYAHVVYKFVYQQIRYLAYRTIIHVFPLLVFFRNKVSVHFQLKYLTKILVQKKSDNMFNMFLYESLYWHKYIFRRIFMYKASFLVVKNSFLVGIEQQHILNWIFFKNILRQLALYRHESRTFANY